jgi:hypothetical protein
MLPVIVAVVLSMGDPARSSLTVPFTGTIFGLMPKDSIDLADLPWVPGKMMVTYSRNSGTLTITDGSQSVSLKLSGNYTNATWGAFQGCEWRHDGRRPSGE